MDNEESEKSPEELEEEGEEVVGEEEDEAGHKHRGTGLVARLAMDILQQKSGATIQDAGRTIAGAQLYDLLTSFDREAFAGALVKKPELYLRIIGTLARLSEGEAACAHLRALESALMAKEKTGQGDAEKKIISAETLKEILHQTKIL